MNTILELDQSLFHFINQDLANGVLDAIMPWWRDKKTWIPLYLILIAFSVIKYRLKGLFFVLAVILAASLADVVSSHVMKPAFERVRPCNDEAMAGEVRLLVGCGKAYSFTSSHATNHFAVATVIALTLGLLFPWLRWVAYGWAASIAFGQVYVGVHYPTDVLVGGLIGWIIGNIVAKIYLRFPVLSIASTRNKQDPVS
jgi:membrane-associated phospholipid phosphatase